MTDRWLEEAATALRDTTSGHSGRASSTRARVLRGLEPRAARRRWVWLLPAIAVLGGGTALAANPQRTARWVNEAGEWLGLSATPPPPRDVAAAVASSAAFVKRPASPVRAMPIAPAAPPAASASSVPYTVPRPTAPAPVASQASKPDPSLPLYQAAHEAHFRDRDFSAALAAWDRYLRSAPRGAFATEARYNRAIALLRLGRTVEARSALEPFAAGVYGSYRQADARRLLDAMPSTGSAAPESSGEVVQSPQTRAVRPAP